MTRLRVLQESIVACTRCPELRAYCDDVARTKRRAYEDWDYWGKPVPGFGDENAKIMIVGLAPGAHGANRTGRMFTGDRSGDFLYAALHRAGFANQPHSVSRDDGLSLRGVYISAAVRCAPPANKPTPTQRANCLPYLVEEIRLLKPRVLVCLGSIGWDAALTALREVGRVIPTPRPKFGHAREITLGEIALLGCYHVSQQNTFTGRLTEPMIDAVLRRAGAGQ
ncbi:MAG TPA: uracil-DNA glycosylase [Phycisphaerales bacterium]|nr:uracil-DNA glycosylase [Phycisphaerales bacterium]HRQ75392.1 uracil-DNA glycosylase [Phycisphaerales bacterium]